jgi:hypothetical protein
MEKQTKILLGVGAVIAAYLIFKPKKAMSETSVVMPNNIPNDFPDLSKILDSKKPTTPQNVNTPLVNKIWDELNNPQNLTYRYKVVKDINFGGGYFNHGISFNSMAPKVGDIIEAKGAIELPPYMGGGTVYPYTICVSQPEGKECRDVFISYDALENLGQLIYT